MKESHGRGCKGRFGVSFFVLIFAEMTGIEAETIDATAPTTATMIVVAFESVPMRAQKCRTVLKSGLERTWGSGKDAPFFISSSKTFEYSSVQPTLCFHRLADRNVASFLRSYIILRSHRSTRFTPMQNSVGFEIVDQGPVIGPAWAWLVANINKSNRTKGTDKGA
jgi:hypothetical protein